MKKQSVNSISTEVLQKIITYLSGYKLSKHSPLYIHHNLGEGGPHFVYPVDGGYYIFKNDGSFQKVIPMSFIESKMDIVLYNLLQE